MRSFGIVKLNIGSDTCLKFARTHLFCQHPTKGYDNLDILSGTLRVPGGRALFLSLFLNVFLFNGWGNRNRVRPAAAIRFALFRAEAELEN